MNRILQAQTALLMAGVCATFSQSTIWSQPHSGFAKSFAATDVSTNAPSEEIQRLASSGHLREELELARDYYAGHGVARDVNQAAYWYRKAADQGDPGAQVDLGYLYLKGIGVKPDAAQAARWFQRAASSGSAAGKLNLAVLYLKGKGVPQDARLAVGLLNELARHGDPRGEAYLGLLYMLGVGVREESAGRRTLVRQGREASQPRRRICDGYPLFRRGGPRTRHAEGGRISAGIL